MSHLTDDSSQCSALCARIGHTFKDNALLQQALTHRSVGGTHNERLEFLGDSLLNCIVTQQLFHQFPGTREGKLSRMRASLVKGVTLAKLARDLRLGEYLRLGSGELKSGGRNRESILADAFEALVGALFLDAGYGPTETFLLKEYATHLSKLDADTSNKDAKTQLQEILQARQQKLPEYRVVEEKGAEHNLRFTVACKAQPLRQEVRGEGRSRREAEQEAARVALEFLDQQ